MDLKYQSNIIATIGKRMNQASDIPYYLGTQFPTKNEAIADFPIFWLQLICNPDSRH